MFHMEAWINEGPHMKPWAPRMSQLLYHPMLPHYDPYPPMLPCEAKVNLEPDVEHEVIQGIPGQGREPDAKQGAMCVSPHKVDIPPQLICFGLVTSVSILRGQFAPT